MSKQVVGSCALVLAGAVAVWGCGSRDDSSDEIISDAGRAAGGSAGQVGAGGSTAGRAELPGAGGAMSAAGIGGTFSPPTGGANAGGRSPRLEAGSGGAFEGEAGRRFDGEGGEDGFPGSPTDPECANLTPVDGEACDADGPRTCAAEASQCVCFGQNGDAATWRCFDIGGGEGGSGAAQGGRGSFGRGGGAGTLGRGDAGGGAGRFGGGAGRFGRGNSGGSGGDT